MTGPQDGQHLAQRHDLPASMSAEGGEVGKVRQQDWGGGCVCMCTCPFPSFSPSLCPLCQYSLDSDAAQPCSAPPPNEEREPLSAP